MVYFDDSILRKITIQNMNVIIQVHLGHTNWGKVDYYGLACFHFSLKFFRSHKSCLHIGYQYIANLLLQEKHRFWWRKTVWKLCINLAILFVYSNYWTWLSWMKKHEWHEMRLVHLIYEIFIYVLVLKLQLQINILKTTQSNFLSMFSNLDFSTSYTLFYVNCWCFNVWFFQSAKKPVPSKNSNT